MTLLFAVASTIFSGFCLSLLMLSDLKRSARVTPYFSIPQFMRTVLGVLWGLPIVILFVIGQFSSLLIWLGAVTILGWILAFIPQK